MTRDDAAALVRAYYDRFNARDEAGFLALLAPDVVHEPSQGTTRRGVDAFAGFLAHMNRCYRERVRDLVVLAADDGARAAAEFMLDGEYVATDEGLPPARGQRYALRVGAFFELRDGRVARVSNHYNLRDWLRQVGG
jgi:steroid delta-isomerase-like uncharacterized protein